MIGSSHLHFFRPFLFEARHFLTSYFILNSRSRASFYQLLRRNNVSLVYLRIDECLSDIAEDTLKPAENSLKRPQRSPRLQWKERVLREFSVAFRWA